MSPSIRVAFLGPEGTYTHQALLQQFGDSSDTLTIHPQDSIKACFDCVSKKEVDYAVVPSENSTNGQVVFTYDLLRDWFMPKEGVAKPGFSVVAEQFVSIHHYLFSKASDLTKVTKLYSHPQVWGQVSEFLQHEKFSGKYSRIDTNSTAQAAEKVFEDVTETSACISSEMSGKLYSLPTKASEIEDLKGNTTRFLILGQEKGLVDEISVDEESEKADAPTAYVTLLIFVLNDNDPGALCEALNCFKVNRVNLTAIASRPSKKTPWEYAFFVEAEGSGESVPMKKSVAQLQEHCSRVATIGSFKRSWRYKKQ